MAEPRYEEEVDLAPREQTVEDEREVFAYWTDERLAKAEPLPLPTLKGEPEGLTAAAGEPTVELAKPPDDFLEGDSAACFRTSRVSNMNTWPYQVVGKMFMSFPNGGNYVGSAWTIYESSVFTAGHCVFDKNLGGWARNVAFYPRYNNGSTIGGWAARSLVSLVGWTRDRNFTYDLGAFITTRAIRPQTGSLGWIANSSPSLGSPFTAVGYPAQPIPGYNFDGRYMWQSVGNYLGGTSILKMCNNMTGGCSGGPWSIVYNGVNAYGKGVNSHRYSSDPNSMYSPAFGQGFLNITDWLKANGGN